MGANDSPRWCDHHDAYGDHHTDRCPALTARDDRIKPLWAVRLVGLGTRYLTAPTAAEAAENATTIWPNNAVRGTPQAVRDAA